MDLDKVEGNWLYPGDVIYGLKLPNLKRDEFHLVPLNDERLYSVRLMMSNKYFVYLSHECDFNSNKRQFFVLTPMIGIDSGIRRNRKEFERLIESNDVKAHPHYLNLFYYGPFEAVFPEDKLIDFTRVVSVPVTSRQELLDAKRLQLDTESRRLIKEKMAYYFSHEE